MSAREAPGIRIANPDPQRNPRQEVPDVTVESREYVPSLLELADDCKDPAFKYRWVNVAPLKIARAKAKGYVVVDPNEEEIRNLVGESPGDDGGVYRMMDVILMKCPRTTHKSRRQRVAEKTKTRLGNQKRKFKKQARSLGEQRYNVPVQVITDKEPPGSKD